MNYWRIVDCVMSMDYNWWVLTSRNVRFPHKNWVLEDIVNQIRLTKWGIWATNRMWSVSKNMFLQKWVSAKTEWIWNNQCKWNKWGLSRCHSAIIGIQGYQTRARTEPATHWWDQHDTLWNVNSETFVITFVCHCGCGWLFWLVIGVEH